MRIRITCALAALVTIIVCAQRTDAVIKADTPLKAIVPYDYILVGKVEQYYADKPALLVTVSEDIKGKAPYRTLPINCKVADAKIAKENQIEPLLKRFGPGIDIVFFIKTRGKTHTSFAFTNGTWFHVQGQLVEQDKIVFGLVSAEPYFRKTYHGTTAELVKLLKDHAAGKATLPEINSKIEPGFGPEYMPKEKSPGASGALRAIDVLLRPAPSGGGCLAVIPTIGIGAPLMILAMLFPTIFGGVFVLFRQWMAFITVISLNSTLMLLHWWLAPMYLRGTWWNTDAALWFAMTLVAFACTLWAWRRQLDLLSSGEHEVPTRTELAVLGFISVSCLGTAVAMWYFAKPSWLEAGWAVTMVMTVGILAGTLYRGLHALKKPTLFAAPTLATEGVILGVMLLGHLLYVPLIGGGLNTEGSAEGSGTTIGTSKVAAVKKRWDFTMTDAGLYCSSPLVDGEFIYAAAAHPTFRGGTLVCLDRQTGMKKWEFIDDGTFKQVISSPCIADGKLYFGEGFHDDPNCKVYCVNAADGKKIWDFTTKGQTESSPTVAGGKVYIGAGNDGVYCLDAANGKLLWKFPPADYQGRLLRFGAGMVVVGDRLYFGSGTDRNQKGDKGETAVFCLDRHTGKQIWKADAPYAVWSTPIVMDGAVYIGSGNGDIFEDDPSPGGALLCLDANDGKETWRFKVENGIIEAPAVDAQRVYFGCRDGQIYCIGRAKGEERWKRFLESPVISTPVLDTDVARGRTVSVFALASGGKIFCLDPKTGDNQWIYNLTDQRPYISASPQLTVTPTADGYLRHLYFGCGLGGGARDITSHRAVIYCLEDQVKVE